MPLEYLHLSSDQLKQLQTPCYIYSETHLSELVKAFEHELTQYPQPSPIHWHYAIKANHNPKILQFFLKRGVGIDLVSGGELNFARDLGFSPKKMVFSGVGKSRRELRQAIELQIGMLQIESVFEFEQAREIAAELGKQVAISFRVNPDIDPKTHPYISTGLNQHKFGMTFDEARLLYLRAIQCQEFHVQGMSLHIGSQMMDLKPLSEAVKLALNFARELKAAGVPLSILNVGGGLGIPYERPLEMPNFRDYAKLLSEVSKEWFALQGEGSQIFTECGRALTAQCGFLFSRVLGVKQSRGKNFAVIEASMTELLRPSLYQAFHPIWVLGQETCTPTHTYEVVGPVCESSDVLGRSVPMTELKEGSWVVVGAVGAYGYVMSNFYNLRALPEEWWLSESQQLECVRPLVKAFSSRES